MKQRFKVRELWLLVPFLLLGAGAFYWQRLERVSAPDARGMHVSDFELKTAPGYWREKGYSHEAQITISHPWPRPKWWGTTGSVQSQCDPLHPEAPQRLIRGTTPADYMAPGAALTVVRDGKSVRWPDKYAAQSDGIGFRDNQYVVTQRLKLSAIPTQAGEVTFHGLYRIVGQPQISLKRGVRKAGQSLPMPNGKNPGARIVEINATPFVRATGTAPGGKTKKEDICWIQFQIQDLKSPLLPPQEARTVIYDVEVEDENGQIIRPYSTKGFTQGTMSDAKTKGETLAADQRRGGVGLNLDQVLPTTGRLTMRGKVSLDWEWPMSFEVTLPSRRSSQSFISEAGVYPIPLWRDGKPVEPK